MILIIKKGVLEDFLEEKKQVEPIWNEFINSKEELLFESERILAEMEGKNIASKFADLLIGTENLEGYNKLREVKTRVNQNVFRQIVLANYSSKCAISGIDIPQLLLTSHIIPWAKNESERLNTENGICLSSLYDKAFDKGSISLTTNYCVILSNELKQKKNMSYFPYYFSSIEGKKIQIPSKFLPNQKFIEYHNDCIFLK